MSPTPIPRPLSPNQPPPTITAELYKAIILLQTPLCAFPNELLEPNLPGGLWGIPCLPRVPERPLRSALLLAGAVLEKSRAWRAFWRRKGKPPNQVWGPGWLASRVSLPICLRGTLQRPHLGNHGLGGHSSGLGTFAPGFNQVAKMKQQN